MKELKTLKKIIKMKNVNESKRELKHSKGIENLRRCLFCGGIGVINGEPCRCGLTGGKDLIQDNGVIKKIEKIDEKKLEKDGK